MLTTATNLNKEIKINTANHGGTAETGRNGHFLSFIACLDAVKHVSLRAAQSDGIALWRSTLANCQTRIASKFVALNKNSAIISGFPGRSGLMLSALLVHRFVTANITHQEFAVVTSP